MHPTIERVKELLCYDPISGKLTWRVHRCNKVRAGREAGRIGAFASRVVEVDRKRYWKRNRHLGHRFLRYDEYRKLAQIVDLEIKNYDRPSTI